jgi:hypothetical protein
MLKPEEMPPGSPEAFNEAEIRTLLHFQEVFNINYEGLLQLQMRIQKL